MIIETIVVCFLAKLRHNRLKFLFRSWTFYPIFAVQLILVVFVMSVFLEIYYFGRFVRYVEPAIILSFVAAIFMYKLYKPAIAGSASILAGTLLNKFVIAQNSGKMPVFPSLSYLSGYADPRVIGSAADSVHILGGAGTKFNFLADYIDFGYCILSPGDVLIHLFYCIMLFYVIKAVNARYGAAVNEIKMSGEK